MVGFVGRLIAAIVLVFATYNPTEYNYFTWSQTAYQENLSMTVLFGLLLLVGYIIFLRATLRSIGPFGAFLVAAIFGAFLWVLADNGFLAVDDAKLMTWIGLFGLALILAIGLSWSHVRRALSGQSDVDDVDE